MSRGLAAFDRIVVLIIGLGLIVLGLFALDWRYQLVFDNYANDLNTAPVEEVTTQSWFPIVAAVVTVIWAILALIWVVSHIRAPRSKQYRLESSDPTGQLKIDLRSIASLVATDFDEAAPVANVRGAAIAGEKGSFVRLNADLESGASGEAVQSAFSEISHRVDRSMGKESIPVQVLIDGVNHSVGERKKEVRVQ
ncbi:alkaline shock response membrane anchor protein AmaP [Ornithinimicrobium sp. Arc0846-15]|nr:alkaline shock response membrane anchor protein AmaP [Ornithinimicrobium laminariae]